MISPISRKSSRPSPRVVSAGEPIRSPEVTRGGRGSNGTALRLTVMRISCRRSSASWPAELALAQVDEQQVHVGAAGQDADAVARPEQRLGERLRTVERAALALAEALAGGDPQRHGLGGDHVLRAGRPAARGRPPSRSPWRSARLAQDHPAARTAQRLVRRRRDDVGAEARPGWGAGRRRRGPRSAPCRPSAARRPRRRSRGSARSRAGADRPTSPPAAASGGARARAARPRPCRSGCVSRSTS